MPPVTCASGLRDFLRQETRQHHQALDDLIGGLDLSSQAGLRRLLLLHAAIVPSLEQHLEDAGIERLLPDWHLRRRRDALWSDIAAFELAVPPPAALSFDMDDAVSWGISYVLEGSRLGARHILRRLEHAAVPPSAQATRFLRHGEGQRLWPNFVHRLNASALPDCARAKAGTAARQVFDAYERQLLTR